MTKTEFLQKAMDGGWTPVKLNRHINCDIEGGTAEEEYQIDLKHTVLDPEAWKAVGKVEGWDDKITLETARSLFSATWNGDVSVEEYLETL